MPPLPKPQGQARRRNKRAGIAKLEPTENLEHVPQQWRELPPERPRPFAWPADKHATTETPRTNEWHALTTQWWTEVVRSPMSKEYLSADWPALFRVCCVIDDFNHGGDPKLLAEIRQAQAAFGLTPIDRRRLQWEAQRAGRADIQRRATSTEQLTDTALRQRPDPRLRLLAQATTPPPPSTRHRPSA